MTGDRGLRAAPCPPARPSARRGARPRRCAASSAWQRAASASARVAIAGSCGGGLGSRAASASAARIAASMPSHSRCSRYVSRLRARGLRRARARPALGAAPRARGRARCACFPLRVVGERGRARRVPSSARSVVVTRSKQEAIVRHEHERARELEQALLEHLERRDVEVVRRLVEHEQVGGLEHQPRDQDARLLAAREPADRHRRAARGGRGSAAPSRRRGSGCPPKTTCRPRARARGAA